MSSPLDLLVDCDMLRKEEGKVAAGWAAFCGVYETSWTADVGAEEPKSPGSPKTVTPAEPLGAVGNGVIGDDFGGKGGYLNIGANARALSLPLKDFLFDKPSATGL